MYRKYTAHQFRNSFKSCGQDCLRQECVLVLSPLKNTLGRISLERKGKGISFPSFPWKERKGRKIVEGKSLSFFLTLDPFKLGKNHLIIFLTFYISFRGFLFFFCFSLPYRKRVKKGEEKSVCMKHLRKAQDRAYKKCLKT